MTITLTQNDARFVLEALQMLENKWLEINRTSGDEDEQAEYGMDALDLNGTREFIQREAVKAVGQGATDFSRQPFAVAPK
jgi:hypothetical protein